METNGQEGHWLADTDDFNFEVEEDCVGTRLDHFLASQLPHFSRSQITASIKDGQILLNGAPAKASKKLQQDDTISGAIHSDTEMEIIPQDISFPVLHEDNDLLVISKPPNLVVHPGSGNWDNTLVNGLVYYCNNLKDVGDPLRPGIVHRLDKDTSGVMVVAKSQLVHRLLVDQFKSRNIVKRYKAILQGSLQKREGRIVKPIGRHPVNRKKMSVNEINGKYAATNWSIESENDKGYCLADIIIETGRTHQIRVHMASIGLPVTGDVLYGGKTNTEIFPRQMLHSHEIRFSHPVSSKMLKIKAPLWPDMENALTQLSL